MSPEDFMLPGGGRLVDIYKAFAQLLKHPRIDPEGMAIMGFSMGGYVTLLSTQERFRRVYGPPNFRFAAHIAIYPAGCNVRLRDDLKVTPRRRYASFTEPSMIGRPLSHAACWWPI